MDRTYAFVDESGNSDLETSKGGSSDLFIVYSVLVEEKDLGAAYAQAEALRKRHFQTGEIKSSNLKPKDSHRRARILNELAELPFKLYFTVVDKYRIHKDGGIRTRTVNQKMHESCRLKKYTTQISKDFFVERLNIVFYIQN